MNCEKMSKKMKKKYGQANAWFPIKIWKLEITNKDCTLMCMIIPPVFYHFSHLLMRNIPIGYITTYSIFPAVLMVI